MQATVTSSYYFPADGSDPHLAWQYTCRTTRSRAPCSNHGSNGFGLFSLVYYSTPLENLALTKAAHVIIIYSIFLHEVIKEDMMTTFSENLLLHTKKKEDQLYFIFIQL